MTHCEGSLAARPLNQQCHRPVPTESVTDFGFWSFTLPSNSSRHHFPSDRPLVCPAASSCGTPHSVSLKPMDFVSAFTGARRGEIRAMAWENYRDGEPLIDCSLWNGITTEPKSKKSRAPIPTSAGLQPDCLPTPSGTVIPFQARCFPRERAKRWTRTTRSVHVLSLFLNCLSWRGTT